MENLNKRIKVICIAAVWLLINNGPTWAEGGKVLKIIELTGSYTEIGEKWGQQLKSEIEKSIQIEINDFARFFGMEFDFFIDTALKLVPAAKEFDPDFMTIIEGIAKGSGRSFEEIFALRSVLEVLFYFQKLSPMCTSFAVGADATKDHTTIIGQNIDWHSGIPMAVLKITWPNGVKQLALSLGGIWEYPLIVPPSGVPFAMASNLTVSMTDKQEVTRPPVSIVMNKAARQKRLEQALSVMINAQQNMAGFILASAQNDMIGIEHAANQYEVLYPENQILVRSNHYLTDRFKPMDFFGPYVPDSYLRYIRLKQLIQKDLGKITPELMMKKMADHNCHPKGICAHVDKASPYPPSQTLASIIMVPEKKTAYIAAGQPCKTKYVEYTLE